MENQVQIVVVSDDERLHRKIVLLTQYNHTSQYFYWFYPSITNTLQFLHGRYYFIDLDSTTVNMWEWLNNQPAVSKSSVYCFSRAVTPELVQKVKMLSFPSIIPRSKVEELLQQLVKGNL